MKAKALMFLLGTMGLSAVSTTASAADGCKFMLCMGATNPMGIAECASVVKEVLHDLRKGRPFPTCKMSNGLDSKSSGSWVAPSRAPMTPPCPSGTKQGADGVVYHQGKMPTNIRRTISGTYSGLTGGYQNIGGTDSRIVFGKQADYSQRVCVGGNLLGTYKPRPMTNKDGDMVNLLPHQWYEKVMVMKPDGATYEFKFYIDNQLYSSHRF